MLVYFTSSHSSLMLSDHDVFVSVHVCIMKTLNYITYVLFGLYSCCVFPQTLFPFYHYLHDIPDVVILAFGEVLAVWELPLWKSIARQCGMSSQASLKLFLLLLFINTTLTIFSRPDCAYIYLVLSFIGKSHWRCKTTHELWMQKREKCSSERFRSGQLIHALTDGSKKNMLTNIWLI